MNNVVTAPFRREHLGEMASKIEAQKEQPMEQMKALHRAIKTAGSMRELGLLIGCTTGQISMWKHRGNVPPQYVLPIEKATGVSRHLLRPDLYPEGRQ